MEVIKILKNNLTINQFTRPDTKKIEQTAGDEPASITYSIIEPHSDDAAFSLGGTLVRCTNTLQIITIFGNSSSTNPAAFPDCRLDREAITALRSKEAQLAAGLLGAKNVYLEFDESDLQKQRSEQQKMALLLTVKERLLEILDLESLLFLPGGFGGHPDHLLCYDLARFFPNHVLYEEYAPSSFYAGNTDCFWQRYSELLEYYVPFYIDTAECKSAKAKLISQYSTQLPVNLIEQIARHSDAVGLSARFLGKGLHYESAERIYLPNDRCQKLLSLFTKAFPRHPKTGCRYRRAPGVIFEAEDKIFLGRQELSLGRGQSLGRAMLSFCSYSRSWLDISTHFSMYTEGSSRAALNALLDFGALIEEKQGFRYLTVQPSGQSTELDHISASSLLLARRTRRDILPYPIPCSIVQTVISEAAKKRRDYRFPMGEIPSFSYPSSGGLGALQIFLLAYNVATLPQGLYEYDGLHDLLSLKSAYLPLKYSLYQTLNRQDWVIDAPAVLIIVANEILVEKKYQNKAVELLESEAGHLSQNLQLVACALGLGCVVIKGFDEKKCSQCVPYGRPLLALLIGKTPEGPTGEPDLGDKLPLLSLLSAKPESPALCSELMEDSLYQPAVMLRKIAANLEVEIAKVRPLFVEFDAVGIDFRQPSGYSKSVIKALCEAVEIDASFSADCLSLASGPLPPQGQSGIIIPPDRLLLDPHQESSLKIGSTDLGHSGSSISWCCAMTTATSQKIWIPTDAVLLSRQHLSYAILPTSSGLGCGSVFEDACRHATLEAIEKKLAKVLVWNEVPVEMSDRQIALLAFLGEKNRCRMFRCGEIFFAVVMNEQDNFAGSCVSFESGGCIDRALLEAVMLRIKNGAPPHSFEIKTSARSNWESLQEALKFNQIELSYVILKRPAKDSAANIDFSSRLWVVKVVPYKL